MHTAKVPLPASGRFVLPRLRGSAVRTRMSTPTRASLSSAQIESLVQDAVVWANQHGLVVALKDKAFTNPDMAIIHAPLSCMPVSFPSERFLQAKTVMPLFNKVVDRVARDEQYLETTLEAAAKYDDFTKRLLDVLRATRHAREQLAGPELVLGIHRSDYMLDAPSGGFLQGGRSEDMQWTQAQARILLEPSPASGNGKQQEVPSARNPGYTMIVELNTIASSFGCLSSLTTRLHTYISSRVEDMDTSLLPPNNAIEGIPAALAAAAKAHGAVGGVVVMVVQPGERNAYDQQWLQLQLWEQHRVRTLRCTLGEISREAKLGPGGALSIRGHPVSVVYFRAGYTPTDYPSEQEWQARELIERSNAARCPTVAYQLAGAKKVQQDLARPGVLEQFTDLVAEATQLRSFFAGLWGLDDLAEPATAEAVAQALANPEAFVLKPQREGGGNNLYGEELVKRLSDPEGLSAFILMQKILPPAQRSIMVRNGEWKEADTVSELGIYGTFLRKGEEVLLNEEVGHLVRTKTTDSNEGGVAAGFAVLDSPYLV